MGGFLVIIPSHSSQDEVVSLFRHGLTLARQLKRRTPSSILARRWVQAASFAQERGAGMPIVTDAATGSWLLAIGTWFHREDYARGAESCLLSRYLDVGPVQLGQELEGFFTIVIGDARTQETIVLTDIMGSCHGFVRAWKHAVALSGSSLLLAGLGDVSLDAVGCQEFLRTGTIYQDRTFYREIRKLEPATVYRFGNEGLKEQRRYWRIADIVPESLRGQAAVKGLEETLVCAAQRVGRLFVRPVCDLTGGYDSRAVVAAFLTAGVPFSTTVTGPAESPDVIVSRGLAQDASLPLVHLTPQGVVTFDQVKATLSFTDGEYDLIEYARILDVHRTLSERFDVSINGSFGEIARGYWWDLLFPRTGVRCPLNAEKLARRRYAVQTGHAALFPPETRLNLISHFTDIIERTNEGMSGLPNSVQMDHAYLAMRMQRWQGRIASSTNQLWPCLSLFLLRSVLETLLQTETRLRRRNLLIRQMLAEMQPRLAAFPLEHGYPALPVTWRTVHRFWPLPQSYGKRMVLKLHQLVGSSQGSPPHRHDSSSARLRLWHVEEVRELLQPAAMKLCGLLDLRALRNFLEWSQRDDFPYDPQWSRLLSLEYTLHALAYPTAAVVAWSTPFDLRQHHNY